MVSKRKQQIKINYHTRQPPPTTRGAPQGSILGLIVFTICINERCNNINGHYAEDRVLSFAAKYWNKV